MTAHGRKRSRTMILTSFATTAAAVALVIWIKLRVVSTIPKQAYADPENSASAASAPVEPATRSGEQPTPIGFVEPR